MRASHSMLLICHLIQNNDYGGKSHAGKKSCGFMSIIHIMRKKLHAGKKHAGKCHVGRNHRTYLTCVTKMTQMVSNSTFNGRAHFEKCKQFFEYQHLLLLTSTLLTQRHLVVKVLIYISMQFISLTPGLIRHLWQLNTVVFHHRCLICALLL